jgi:hypothetical protein
MKILLVILLFATLLFAVEEGKIEILNQKSEAWNNSSCQTSSTCDLKEYKLYFHDYRIWVQGQWQYGSKIYTSYQTDKVENLEKYIIVQFERGCVFNSTPTKKYIQYATESFNETVPYKFPTWVIDSFDSDPAWWSYTGEDHGIRHYYYSWPITPGVFDDNNDKLYGVEKPTIPLLYTSYLPMQFFMSSMKEAINISLGYKTCIYKTDQVITSTTRDNLGLDNGNGVTVMPLHCFNWDSLFTYNYKTKKVERKIKIDSFCQDRIWIE